VEFVFIDELGWTMWKAENDDVDDIEYFVDIRSANLDKEEDLPFA
jgi:hypothetical protein